MIDQQLKRGLLEMVVLASLKDEASYGYKIITDVVKVIEISESTLYPILRRLEQQGFVETYQVEYMSRLRKYYKMTTKGSIHLKTAYSDYLEIKKNYDYILR